MQIIRHPALTPHTAKDCVLAIGNFDGLHRGHQFLLESARQTAVRDGRELAVLSFEPHPKKFFVRHLPPFRLTPFQSKYNLLKKSGVDYFFCLHFDHYLSRLSAGNFVRHILIDGIGASAVFVGSDFVFGHERGGDIETLRNYSAQGFFKTHAINLLNDRDTPISSSRIREALKSGDCNLAAQLLGRPWQITGHVRSGQKLGRQIGVPTANISMRDYQHPKYGVYAVRVKMPDGSAHNGVANIGIRPTVCGKWPQCEVHLFDFNGNLYGARLAVDLIEFIRDEKKFNGIEELKSQIARDIEKSKSILGSLK